MSALIAPFVSRPDQLKRRGSRRFGHFMMFTSGRVAEHGPERRRWQAEDIEDERKDAIWAKRHGSIVGGAVVVPFAGACEKRRGVRTDEHAVGPRESR